MTLPLAASSTSVRPSTSVTPVARTCTRWPTASAICEATVRFQTSS